MNCSKCGNSLHPNDNICAVCGTVVPKNHCTSCGAQFSVELNVCPSCGKSEIIKPEVPQNTVVQTDAPIAETFAAPAQAESATPFVPVPQAPQPTQAPQPPLPPASYQNMPYVNNAVPVMQPQPATKQPGTSKSWMPILICIQGVLIVLLAVLAIFLLVKSNKSEDGGLPVNGGTNSQTISVISEGESHPGEAKEDIPSADSSSSSISNAAETTTTQETTTEPTTSPAVVQPEITAEYQYHATVVAEGGLNMRTGPGTTYEKIVLIPDGSMVVEYGSSSAAPEWLYIEYNGQFGWVSLSYLMFEGGMAKPVLYLYPEKATDVKVSLNIKNGALDCTYPKYNNGWRVTAYPDGKLINKADGLEYSYIFWDATAEIKYDFSSGFVVKGKDTASFLREKLSYMGLTPEEYNEFIVYWLPIMEQNKYNLISFQNKTYTDAAQLKISPQPDSLLRIFMAFKPLDKKISIPEQKLSSFTRKGFTAVEWGGTQVD